MLSMGQPVRVVTSQLVDDSVLRIEIDRSLTGMGHERYVAGGGPFGDRPADLLAEHLFATDNVLSLHVFSNVLTVTLRSSTPAVQAQVEELVHGLFIHYRPGVLPTAVTP